MFDDLPAEGLAGDDVGVLSSVTPGPIGEQPRNAFGQFRSRSSLRQGIPGSSAVDDFVALAEANGFDIVGREVSVRTPFGGRRYDVVLRNLQTGEIGGVEIKSSQAAFDRFDAAARQQSAADRFVSRNGAVATGRFEGVEIDSAIKILWEIP